MARGHCIRFALPFVLGLHACAFRAKVPVAGLSADAASDQQETAKELERQATEALDLAKVLRRSYEDLEKQATQALVDAKKQQGGYMVAAYIYKLPDMQKAKTLQDQANAALASAVTQATEAARQAKKQATVALEDAKTQVGEAKRTAMQKAEELSSAARVHFNRLAMQAEPRAVILKHEARMSAIEAMERAEELKRQATVAFEDAFWVGQAKLKISPEIFFKTQAMQKKAKELQDKANVALAGASNQLFNVHRAWP